MHIIIMIFDSNRNIFLPRMWHCIKLFLLSVMINVDRAYDLSEYQFMSANVELMSNDDGYKRGNSSFFIIFTFFIYFHATDTAIQP